MSVKKYARTVSPTEKATFHPIERPKSIFDFNKKEFNALPSLHRILSQVRTCGVKTIVKEKIDSVVADDLREENEDYEKTSVGLSKSLSWRLAFFDQKIDSENDLSQISPESFLGYAIVKQDEFKYPSPNQSEIIRVFESIIRRKEHKNNYVHKEKRWHCLVGGKDFSLTGYLYAQQNAITNTCAHVACRTVASVFHQNGDMTYREMNELLGYTSDIDQKIRKGLDSNQIRAILESAGATCYTKNLLRPEDEELRESHISRYQKWVYGSIESGYPAILLFSMPNPRKEQSEEEPDNVGHAVPIFGHTFNEDTWVPKASVKYFQLGKETLYIPSVFWASMFIGHDDNFGSNYCIPQYFLPPVVKCDKLDDSDPSECLIQKEKVAVAIATFPREVKCNAVRAEGIGLDYLIAMLLECPNYEDKWLDYLKAYLYKGEIVLRTVLINGTEYKGHLERIRDWNNNGLDNLDGIFPEWFLNSKFWMVELSVPELFSANRRKIGEVLIRADRVPTNERDLTSFVFARVSKCLVLFTGQNSKDSRFRIHETNIQGHVELFSSNENLIEFEPVYTQIQR